MNKFLYFKTNNIQSTKSKFRFMFLEGFKNSKKY